MSRKNCQEEYIRKIHKVQDYIEQHLDNVPTIEELSLVAGFSKYHFSRIFQAILHEPLAHYVSRLRMEHALFMLAHRPDKNLTDIALELGYTDSAIFSRAFRRYVGVSPREYRKEYASNIGEDFLLSDYNRRKDEKTRTEGQLTVTGKVTVEKIEEMQVAYVRHTGTYETLGKEYANLIETLIMEAEKQHLLVKNEDVDRDLHDPYKNRIFAIYHDNPEFSEEDLFRTSICLTVPDEIPIREDGILGKMVLEGGLYVVGHFEIKREQYEDAWNYMYLEWISTNGYVPRSSYPFEVYRNNPSLDEKHIHKVDIYVPVEK